VATAPIISLCDALVTALTTGWAPMIPNAVTRVYQIPVKVESLSGRQVWIFPVSYGDEPATRGEDLNSYRVAVVVAERFTDAGDPRTDWVDELVKFVKDEIVDGLEFVRGSDNGMLSISGREIWTAERSEVPVYDVELLTQKKLFWCEIEFVFQEIA
jgi:hypothetical protein